jgi:hypothetical protein
VDWLCADALSPELRPPPPGSARPTRWGDEAAAEELLAAMDRGSRRVAARQTLRDVRSWCAMAVDHQRWRSINHAVPTPDVTTLDLDEPREA